jgi:hypothetical protein
VPDVNIDAAAMAMPIAMPDGDLTGGALLSGGLFALTVAMTPGMVQAGPLDSPPDDLDLGDDDPIFAEDGP